MKNQEIKDSSSKMYASLLELFLNPEDFRESIRTPFVQGEFVLATDAYSIIMFNKSQTNVTEFEKNTKHPNALAVIPAGENINESIKLSDLQLMLLKSKDAVKKKYKIKAEKCPDCFGRGEVDFEFTDYRGNTHEHEHDCPTCEGIGRIDRIANLETGGYVNDFKEVIDWSSPFQAKLIERLAKVAEALNEETVRMVYRTTSLSIHKFVVGDCVICLMPLQNITADCDIVTHCDLFLIS
ncbi:MAG: hypothetical protein Q7J05_04050 [Paludibacter sp.]|nr:hypothetical protein [Paludibacter sp.]